MILIVPTLFNRLKVLLKYHVRMVSFQRNQPNETGIRFDRLPSSSRLSNM